MSWTLFYQIVMLVVLLSVCTSYLIYDFFDNKTKYERKVNK